MSSDYYVYVLFDAYAIPRYVGKGKGNRWNQHESEKGNSLKHQFIRQTLSILGEIPKVKIRSGLINYKAYEIEYAFIKALGRYPNGPLYNLTDKGSGPNSEQVKKWHASRTPEERSATAHKAMVTMGPEGLKARGQKAALKLDRKILIQRMKEVRAKQTPEKRSEIARLAGLASSAKVPYEEKRAQGLRAILAYMTSTTSEERKANAKRTGVGKATKKQLSEWGSKGVRIANANRTPEERTANGIKGGKKVMAARTPEERKDLARKASLAAHKVLSAKTPEERSNIARKRAAGMTAERLTEIALKGVATRRARKLMEKSRKE
jgi:hypothetical protein